MPSKGSNQINLQYATIKSPVPDFIWENLKEFSARANAYQPQPAHLIQKLAAKHKLPAEMIYLTAGIDEAIQIFAKTYGKQALVFTPTYNVYADVAEFGGTLTRIPSIVHSEYTIDPSTKKGATLIFLANPNNPSGFTPQERVLELVKNNPQAIVVIDEAYADFADVSVINEVPKFPNMVVCRSFSKSFGMAGNRVAYFVAHPAITNVVKNKTQWANVSYLSVGAAQTALDHEKYFAGILKGIETRRADFEQFLKNQDYTLIPSRINCVLIKFETEEAGTTFVQYLKEHNVIVSHGNGNSNIGLDKSFVRISIGTAEQMAEVKNIIVAFSPH